MAVSSIGLLPLVQNQLQYFPLLSSSICITQMYTNSTHLLLVTVSIHSIIWVQHHLQMCSPSYFTVQYPCQLSRITNIVICPAPEGATAWEYGMRQARE